MHRCGSGFLLSLAITFVLALGGCLGKSSSNPGNGGVTSVLLSPSGTISIEIGTTHVFSASGKDADGRTVLGASIQFVVVSGRPDTAAPLTVASNGNACAGTWDPGISICNPGTSGIALVTAVIQGVSSPPTTVYVHQHVDSIHISRLDPQGPPPYDCFSQGQTWFYQAISYSNKVDISNTVGPVAWSSSNAGVLTTTPFVPPQQPDVLNQIQATAAAPGITQLSATASGTASDVFDFTTCLIQSVHLQIANQGDAGNSITLNNGGGVTITATAFDTLHDKTNNPPLTNPPLTWSTSNPEVAAFGSITSNSGSNSATARNNQGGAALTASCTPPSCNIGVLPSLPIYASDCLPTNDPPCELPNGSKAYGTISVDVTSTALPPTYTAWSATTGCQNQPGCASALFAVKPGSTPIPAIVNLPRTPNSMLFNHVSAARLYFGTDQGLMYVDIGGNPVATLVSNSPTPCNVSLCGKVLTISNDGKLVAVSDTISSPSQVYIYNGSTGASVNLIIPGDSAIAAAFSPDQLKLFILTSTGKMYVYSTQDALTSVPVATSVTDVKFSVDGSFAYVGGTPLPTSASGFATCDTPSTSVLSGVTTTTVPLALYPSPALQQDSKGNWTQVVVALDPPFVDTFGVNLTYPPPLLQPGEFVCHPPSVVLDPFFAKTSTDLSEGKFTPIYSQLVNNGTQMIVVAQHIPAVIVFDVSDETPHSVPLSDPLGGSSSPLAASASTDGSQVYVAACDQYNGTTCTAGSVHIVCTSNCTAGQGDFQQVPYANVNQDNNPNMCNGLGVGAPLCLPDLIAIQPQ